MVFSGVYRLSEALSSGVLIYNGVQKKRLMIKIISLFFFIAPSLRRPEIALNLLRSLISWSLLESNPNADLGIFKQG